MRHRTTTPTPTAEFLVTFGAHKVPNTGREADAFCKEYERALAELQSRDRTDRAPEWHTSQDQLVDAYTYFVMVARGRRAQFFGVRL